MMCLDELFQSIESDRFSGLVNVASALKTFLRILVAQPEVQQLAELMQSPAVRTAVGERAIVLARSAMATFPPARRSAMIPEPTTVASSSAVPTSSASTRRTRSGLMARDV